MLKKIHIYALLTGLLCLPGVIQAELVTSFTIEDVGSGNILTGGMNPGYDPTLDGFSGAFKFGKINLISYFGASLFTSDIGPIDCSIINPPLSFTTGFLFATIPFVPQTTGPIIADISIVTDPVPGTGVAGEIGPELTVVDPDNDWGWAGTFGSPAGTGAFFNLFPNAVDPVYLVDDPANGITAGDLICGSLPPSVAFVPFEVVWLNRIADTAQYNYKLRYSHCITPTEDLNFAGQRAFWVLEGVMTAPDTTPPTVASINPLDASADHPANVSVSITFSELMDATTVDASSFTVSPTAGGASECASVSTVDNITFTCDPIGGEFTLGEEYTVVVATSVTDSVSDTAIAFSSGFTSTFTVVAPVSPSSGCSLSINSAKSSFERSYLWLAGVMVFLLSIITGRKTRKQ